MTERTDHAGQTVTGQWDEEFDVVVIGFSNAAQFSIIT
jgi:hypothetical protein